MQSIFNIKTDGAGLYEFTDEVVRFAADAGVETGLLTLFVRHTSSSLLISENADPDVILDMNDFFARLVPDANAASMNWLRHTCEGPDDMPAHIKAALTPVSLSIPLCGGVPLLGTWQGIYLFEHRTRSRQREVVGHISP
ncbi:MAG: secondary thiamine-phosphate synthase enzyme YjbQ [Robiginitomaculum sp.]|nr:secondary thiamine-phosphate synthase enzyme YjbQ [Robiginitomaculum sp.]